MKSLLTILMMILSVVGALAQSNRKMVTLSHEGQLSIFDKLSAFEDAYDAAVDGDIIYLSEGDFGIGRGGRRFSLEKQVDIRGCGYNSKLLYTIIIADSIEGTSVIDGVYVNSIEIETNKNVTISNTLIDQFLGILYTEEGGGNILIDRCKINQYYFEEPMSLYSECSEADILFRNSKINIWRNSYSNYHICQEIMENCNVECVYNPPTYASNSIIEKFQDFSYQYYCQGGIFENCLMGDVSQIRGNTNINCWTRTNGKTNVLDDDLECSEDLTELLGVDGTQIGIYGGIGGPYTTYPDGPTVDSENSFVEYDKENNQLSIKIKIIPN